MEVLSAEQWRARRDAHEQRARTLLADVIQRRSTGQRHPVVIHHLVAEGTVDSAILTRLGEKSSTQKALLDHLMSPL